MAQVGDIRRFDSQADFWEGRYQLVEAKGGNTFVAELLEDDEETIERILADDNPHMGGEKEVLRRIDRIGQRLTITIVSREQYDRHF